MSNGFTPRSPDFVGDGVAVWKSKDKDGNVVLNVKKPEWSRSIQCKQQESKPSQSKVPELPPEVF